LGKWLWSLEMTRDTSMDLSIVIVNWNSAEYARECIGSIYEHTRGLHFEVIVVDNASPKGDVDRIKDEFPGITLIKSSENLGFARANNLAAAKASGEFVLFLNPDTKLIQPALEVMVAALRSRPGAGVLGCKLLNDDLSVQTTCIQAFPTILNQALDADALRRRWPASPLWGTAPLALGMLEPVPVEVVSGACMLIRRDVFVQVGMFSEDYFMYAEDVELCRTTHRAGFRNYFIGSTGLIHYGGGSSTPNSATTMKWRSILHYCEKHRGKAYALLFRLTMVVVAMCRLLILSVSAALKVPIRKTTLGCSAVDKWRAILATLLNAKGDRCSSDPPAVIRLECLSRRDRQVGTFPNRYVIVTPARDEAAHLTYTIESVARQTVRPVEWVIVNDGSTDGTAGIIDECVAKYPWIRAVHRCNRGFRKSGGGVVEAFNEGLGAIQSKDWDFIVKLDGDLAFEPDYFERCFRRFVEEPRLGVGGGVICYLENGAKRFEDGPTFHVRGATKIYRKACWEAIGGFWPAPGWDTLDEVKANMLGWRTRNFAELHLVHHRLTGSADGRWGGWVKNGRANYISGYHPLFMMAKCARRLGNRRTLIDGVALMYGFVSGYLKRIPQVDDPGLIAYLRREQLSRIFGRQTIWQ